jgi:hypothetical protein
MVVVAVMLVVRGGSATVTEEEGAMATAKEVCAGWAADGQFNFFNFFLTSKAHF